MKKEEAQTRRNAAGPADSFDFVLGQPTLLSPSHSGCYDSSANDPEGGQTISIPVSKFLVVIALLLAAVNVSSQPQSMSSVKISDLGPSLKEFRENTRISSSRWSTGWLSAVTRIENGVCTKTDLLYGLGEAQGVREQIQDFLSGKPCSASSDGLSSTESGIWAWSVLLTDREFYRGQQEIGKLQTSGLPDYLRQLMNDEVRYKPEDLGRHLDACDGKCSAMTINGAMFSMANHFDEIGKKNAGGLWRYYAFRAARKSDVIRREARQSLKRHAYTLYKQAVTNADFGMAGWVTEAIIDLGFDDTDARKINHHYDDWASAQKKGDYEIGVVVVLTQENPISASHSAAHRHISTSQVRLKVLEGVVNYSILSCRADNGPRQVLLESRSDQQWEIPPEWRSCSVLLLGGKDAKVELWEFNGVKGED